ncbi:hypothetical protein [Sphingobacterium multivorum]|uniref:hypothetical protein n=1 Tax=Sphingobacterium multivorum TaxID=28454 RepID=UPI0031BA9F3E
MRNQIQTLQELKTKIKSLEIKANNKNLEADFIRINKTVEGLIKELDSKNKRLS